MAVEHLERRLQLRGQGQRTDLSRLAAAAVRHLLADVPPEFPVDGHLVAGDVVGDGHARQLHDAALDGVHQREVAHRPREERAFGVTRPADEEGRRREVDDALHALARGLVAAGAPPRTPRSEMPLHRLDARYPEPRRLAVAVRLLALVGVGAVLADAVRARPLAIAVVGLVVEHENVPESHQLGHDALQHLALGLRERPGRPSAPLQQEAGPLPNGFPLAPAEGVVVRDHDARLTEHGEELRRRQLALAVVAVRIVRLQHAQPVADRDAGGDDEEAAREARAGGVAHRVDRLPGDDHRHHGGLAGPRRELERDPPETGVRVLAGALQRAQQFARPAIAAPGRHLGQPDQRLHGLDLAEEGAEVAEFVRSPVIEQPRRLGRDLPVLPGETAPCADQSAQFLDAGGELVLLVLAGEAFALVERHRALAAAAGGRRHRRHERHGPPPLLDTAGRLPVAVELPVARGRIVRRVEHRLFEEIGHGRALSLSLCFRHMASGACLPRPCCLGDTS